MTDNRWTEAVKRWRSLLPEERRRRHLEAIPRYVANSMAMEGEPVDETWIRERLARRIRRLGISETAKRILSLTRIPPANAQRSNYTVDSHEPGWPCGRPPVGFGQVEPHLGSGYRPAS